MKKSTKPEKKSVNRKPLKSSKKPLNDILLDKDIKCSLFIHKDQEDNNNVIIVFQGFASKDECLKFVETYKSDHEEFREVDQEHYGTKYTIH